MSIKYLKPRHSGLVLSSSGVPDTIRTYDLQFRKLTLYPAELRAHIYLNVSTLAH